MGNTDLKVLRGSEITEADLTAEVTINEVYAVFKYHEIQTQSWKIHISCTLSNYIDIINASLKFLLSEKITFKIVKDIEIYLKNSRKTGDRSSYGKFITVYPKSDEEFLVTIEKLYNLLAKFGGPFILTDKRYKDAKCLYYRYGTNKPSGKFDKYGNELFLIKSEEGEEIDNRNLAYFNLAKGIKNPIQDDIDPSESEVLLKRYNVKKVIRFTPVGGIYLVEDKKTDEKLIIKETRPHTGIVDEKIDALYIRKKERDNLAKLACFDFIPKIRGEFYDWENHYLVIEKLKGKRFDDWSIENFPFAFDSKPDEVKKYLTQLIEIIEKLIENLNLVFEKGYYIGDISPDNLLIKNGKINILDLENVVSLTDESTVYSYSKGFGFDNYTVKQNMIYAISSLLLYGLNSNNDFFDLFTIKELLMPISTRYQDIDIIEEAILGIRKSNDLKETEIILKELKEKVSVARFAKKEIKKHAFEIDLLSILKTCESNIKASISPFEDPFSIARGFGGVLLAKKYLDLEISEDEISNHFKNLEFRSLGLYYGLAGQLYLSSMLGREDKEILNYILDNLKKFKKEKDYTVDTGLSGIGLALCCYYKNNADEKVYDAIISIADLFCSLDFNRVIKNSDQKLGFEKGFVGISYFLLSAYSLSENSKHLANAKYLLSSVIRISKLGTNKFIRIKLDIDHMSSPYLKNGEFGLVAVLLYANSISEKLGFDKIIKKILAKYDRAYSLSSGFYEGSGSILYAYLMAYDYYKEEEYLEKALCFSNDINFSYKNDYIQQAYRENELNNYLFGNLSLISLLNIQKTHEFKNMFPFIIGGKNA